MKCSTRRVDNMKTNMTQGWSTLQEGTEHYLYRSVSSMSFARLEALVQRLQDCQNPAIAIPEIVRLANGEVYLKEPRGIRSVEDFLSNNPSTRAKLFVVQQLLKLLENLHTFVGTTHGNLHISCLSIGLDDKLILGGIAPVDGETSDDVDALKPLLAKLFTQPIEAEILRILHTTSLKKMRRGLKALLAEDAWDDIQSDWSHAIRQTNIEESSEELHVEGSNQTNTAESIGHDIDEDSDDPFDFDELDQTLDLGSPLDDLDGMPEPNNIHLQTEEQTLEALFDEFDDLDDLDDFGSLEDDVRLDLEPVRTPVAIEDTPSADPVSEDWSDVDLDSWLDGVPEPSGLQSKGSEGVDLPQSSESTTEAAASTSDTLSPDAFDNPFVEDWFADPEETVPLNKTMGSDIKEQTAADLEEISDFDDDDDETLLFAHPTVEESLRPMDPFTEPEYSTGEEDGFVEELETSADVNTSPASSADPKDNLDWFDNTETADFVLADFEMDALTAEANEQSIDDINEFAVDPFEFDDISPNESDIKAATDIDIEAGYAQPLEDSTDIFSRNAVVGSTDSMVDIAEADAVATEEHSAEMDDWFADTVQHTTESNSTATVRQVEPRIKEDKSMPKWIMVAGATAVVGGAWAATQTRKVDTPSVHIDETQTKSLDTINSFVPTVKTNAVVTTEAGEQASIPEQVENKEGPVTTNDTLDDSKVASVTAKPPTVTKSTRVKKTGQKTAQKKKSRTKAPTPFAKTDKTTATAQSAKQTTAATLPPPKKARQTQIKKEAVVAKADTQVKAPTQVKEPSTESAPRKNLPPTADAIAASLTQADSIAASLTQMVTGTDEQPPVESESNPSNDLVPADPVQENTTEVADVTPDEQPVEAQRPEPSVVAAATSTTDTPAPPAETAEAESADVATQDNNQAVDIEDTLSESVVSEVNATDRVTEDVLETGPGTPRIATTEMSKWSKSSISGSLSEYTVETLQQVPSTDNMFTRANAIVLTHAQQSNDPQLIESSLNNLLSVEANAHKPIYLLAMAQYQFNQQNLDGAREYLMQAEMNWANVERTQLSILRAQRDNIVAHLSYIDFLENGSEDSRLQSLTQFRKVQREARRARLQSLFEQAESKMQKLQRQKR